MALERQRRQPWLGLADEEPPASLEEDERTRVAPLHEHELPTEGLESLNERLDKVMEATRELYELVREASGTSSSAAHTAFAAATRAGNTTSA